MALFAIGDIHLGFAINKTMDKFGENWKNHAYKIEKNWRENIQQCDTVLLLGDISWGMTIQQVIPDLDFIDSLPGKKFVYQAIMTIGGAVYQKYKSYIQISHF